jgi:hypothetical protein
VNPFDLVNAVRELQLPAQEKSVLVALAVAIGARNNGPDCWPSIDTLARWTSLHRATVMKALKSLQARRLITRVPGGGRASTHYTLPDPSLMATGAVAIGDGCSRLQRSLLSPTTTAPGANGDPNNHGTRDLNDQRTDTPVERIFEHWRRVMDHPQARLNAKRRRAVEARLREGYSEQRIIQAIDGCALTPHNMGENERHQRYDDLELICRDGPHVERFEDGAKHPPKRVVGDPSWRSP